MKTLTIALFAAIMSVQTAKAETVLSQLQALIPESSSVNLSGADTGPALATADLRKSEDSNIEPQIANSFDFDRKKAAQLAALAIEKENVGLNGKCYNGVWKDLMAAGFTEDAETPAIPSGSAFEFAVWAKKYPARLENFKLKIVPTPDSYEEIPLGSIVVYAPGFVHANGPASSAHGHIEIITANAGGTLYGCSDGCWTVGGHGNILATQEAKEQVAVLVPVK